MLEFGVTIEGSFGGLADLLDEAARPNLAPLAEQIRQIIVQDNIDKATRGVDAQGNPLAALARTTLDPAHHRGSGPPGSPGGRSFLIDDFQTGIDGGGDRVSIYGGWPGSPKLSAFLDGTSRQPPRNIRGLSREASARIYDLLDGFAAGLLSGMDGALGYFGLATED